MIKSYQELWKMIKKISKVIENDQKMIKNH